MGTRRTSRVEFDEDGRIIASESFGVPPPLLHIDTWYRTVESLWILRDGDSLELGVQLMNPRDERVTACFKGATCVMSGGDGEPTGVISVAHGGGLVVDTLPYGFNAVFRECTIRAAEPLAELPVASVIDPFAHADGDALAGRFERLEIRHRSSRRLVFWLNGHPPVVCDGVRHPMSLPVSVDEDPLVLHIHDRARVDGWEVPWELTTANGLSIQCESIGIAEAGIAGDK